MKKIFLAIMAVAFISVGFSQPVSEKRPDSRGLLAKIFNPKPIPVVVQEVVGPCPATMPVVMDTSIARNTSATVRKEPFTPAVNSNTNDITLVNLLQQPAAQKAEPGKTTIVYLGGGSRNNGRGLQNPPPPKTSDSTKNGKGDVPGDGNGTVSSGFPWWFWPSIALLLLLPILIRLWRWAFAPKRDRRCGGGCHGWCRGGGCHYPYPQNPPAQAPSVNYHVDSPKANDQAEIGFWGAVKDVLPEEETTIIIRKTKIVPPPPAPAPEATASADQKSAESKGDEPSAPAK